MKTTQEYLQILKDYKSRKAAQYGISRIGIFGSVARGEQVEHSDVDICVELDTPQYISSHSHQRGIAGYIRMSCRYRPIKKEYG